MQAAESPLGRALWVTVLSLAVALVIFDFARLPLFGANGQASAFGRPLTLWIAGADADGQAELVARQAAGWLDGETRAGTVGVLPGGSATAVASFLDRVHDTPAELLVITSTTLADLARDGALPEGSELRLRARRAVRLLARAPAIAVLSSDALALAVPGDSSVYSSVQLRMLAAEQGARALFGLADDSWLTDNLAALAKGAGVSGPTPYGLFASTGEAVLGLDAGASQAVLAPHSAIRADLRAHRLRELRWPAGRAPRSWVAIVAAPDLAAPAVARLRARARRLCASTAWRRVLRGDGLSPEPLSARALRDYLDMSLARTARLQALSAEIVRD